MKNALFLILGIGLVFSCGSDGRVNDQKTSQTEESSVMNEGGVTIFENVQPMTGIVVWDGNTNVNSGAHTLEYSYMLFDAIVVEKGVYDWTAVENKLNEIASRNHQTILRFRYTYVGQNTSVPQYIKNLIDYRETKGISENKETWFPDWSHQELKT